MIQKLAKLTKSALVIVCAVLINTQTIYAVSPSSLLDFNANNINTYRPVRLDYCGGGNTDAAGLLNRQTNLDKRWVPLITKEAAAAQADPLAMASLLYWEHRGFPEYGAGPQAGESDNGGRGPWQIIKGSWPSSAGDYMTGVYNPEISTHVAAGMVKNYGGSAGIPIGSIEQDFGNGVRTESMALVAKNYNAGQATWRNPGKATYGQPGRQWMKGTQGPWFEEKQKIIDDYIVAMTYAYYQIATGQVLKNANTNEYVQEALKNQDKIKNFTSAVAGDNCVGAAFNGNIKQTALALAWDTTGHGKNREDAKPIYATTMDKVNGSQGLAPYSDCGVFVATVMIASGADPTYPRRGTAVQLPYLQNHPEKYQEIKTNDTGKLQPGDILIFNEGGDGHTYLYTGEYTNSAGRTFNAASASWFTFVPQAENVYFTQKNYQTGQVHRFLIFRPIQSNTQGTP